MSNDKPDQSAMSRAGNTLALLIIAAVLFVIGSVAVAYYIVSRYHQYVSWSTTELVSVVPDLPSTAIVLGSGITPAGEPRPILKQRLDATVELHSKGLLDRIIVSGYHPYKTYNEPVAMERYLVDKGVPKEIIQKDTNGDNTFATCYQSKTEFGVDRAIVITQPSHLDRAIYLCRSLGIEAYGYPAELNVTRSSDIMQSVRESISNVKAVYEVGLHKIKQN